MNKTEFGAVVSWNCHGVKVLRQALVEALESHGITGVMPRQPGQATYLKRALDAVLQTGMVRKIGEDDFKCSFAVVEEHTELVNADWSGEQVEAVTLLKESGDLIIKKDTPITRKLREELAAQTGNLTSADIGSMLIQCIVKVANGFPMRDRGGVYFVAHKHFGILDAMEAALAECVSEGRIHVQRLAVVAGPREAQDLALLVSQRITEDVIELRKQATKYAQDLINCRPAAFGNRIQTLQSIGQKLLLYRDTLGVKFEEQQKFIEKTIKTMDALKLKCMALRAQKRAEGGRFRNTKTFTRKPKS